MKDPRVQQPGPQSQATQTISYLTLASAPVTPPHQTLVVFILLGQVVIKDALGYCLWDRETTLRSTQGERIQNRSPVSKPEFKSSDKLGDPDQSHQLVCDEHTDHATHVGYSE